MTARSTLLSSGILVCFPDIPVHPDPVPLLPSPSLRTRSHVPGLVPARSLAVAFLASAKQAPHVPWSLWAGLLTPLHTAGRGGCDDSRGTVGPLSPDALVRPSPPLRTAAVLSSDAPTQRRGRHSGATDTTQRTPHAGGRRDQEREQATDRSPLDTLWGRRAFAVSETPPSALAASLLC